MSIVEDAENIAPLGKRLCIGLFVLGTLCIFATTALIGKIPTYYKTKANEAQAETALPSKPDEVKKTYTAAAPTNFQEQTRRKNDINSTIDQIASLLSSAKLPVGNTPRETIKYGVKAGILHPSDAQNMREELDSLQ